MALIRRAVSAVAVTALAASAGLALVPQARGAAPSYSLSTVDDAASFSLWEDPQPVTVDAFGSVVATFPVGTDVQDVTVTSNGSYASRVVRDPSHRTITVQPNGVGAGAPPEGGTHDEQFAFSNLANSSAAPLRGDDPAVLVHVLDSEATNTRVPVTFGLSYVSQAASFSVVKGQQFRVTAPHSVDYQDVTGLTLTPQNVVLLHGTPDDPLSLTGAQLGAQASPDGQALTMTVPASYGLGLSTRDERNLQLVLHVGPEPVGHPVYDSVSVSGAMVVVDPAAVLVSAIYRDLFGRSPDEAGLDTWSDLLRQGTPAGQVSNAITGSVEYRSGLIRHAYSEYLHRVPAQAEVDGWLAAFSRGLTPQQLEAGFAASDEFYNSNGSADAWVAALYRLVLDREAQPFEVASWVGAMQQGLSRYQVALGFELSREHLTTVLDGLYQQLLGRSLDPTGREGWIAALQGPVRLEQVVANIVGSPEYLQRSLALFGRA